MEDLLELAIHGLTLGALYAMVAAGLALMFGVVRLINFAHGEFYMLGGYAFWYAYRELELPYPVAGLAATGILSAFGWVPKTRMARLVSVIDVARVAMSCTCHVRARMVRITVCS